MVAFAFQVPIESPDTILTFIKHIAIAFNISLCDRIA